jgi:hypothetical protein
VDVELKMEPDNRVSLTIKNLTDESDWKDEMDSLISRIKALEERNREQPIVHNIQLDAATSARLLGNQPDNFNQLADLVMLLEARMRWEQVDAPTGIHPQWNVIGKDSISLNKLAGCIGVSLQILIDAVMGSQALRNKMPGNLYGDQVISGATAVEIREALSSSAVIGKMSQFVRARRSE